MVIHTQILPPGVSADDPRLPHAKTISERTYTTSWPIFPQPTFTATIHPSLIAPHEPERRLVSDKYGFPFPLGFYFKHLEEHRLSDLELKNTVLIPLRSYLARKFVLWGYFFFKVIW